MSLKISGCHAFPCLLYLCSDGKIVPNSKDDYLWFVLLFFQFLMFFLQKLQSYNNFFFLFCHLYYRESIFLLGLFLLRARDRQEQKYKARNFILTFEYNVIITIICPYFMYFHIMGHNASQSDLELEYLHVFVNIYRSI